VVWLIIISVLVLQVFPEKLLSRIIATWQVIHPEEAPLLVFSVPCLEDVSVLSFLESKMMAK
jgi:hypothetical protein